MNRYYIGLPEWKDARPVLYRAIIIFTDALTVCIAYALAYYLRFLNHAFVRNFPITKGIPPVQDYLTTAPLVLFMWILAISWQGGYRRIAMPAIDEAIRIARGSMLATILAMSSMFLYREISYSRLVFVLGGAFSFVLLYFWREMLKIAYIYWVHGQGTPTRVLVVGDGYLASTLKKVLNRHGDRAVLITREQSIDKIKRTMLRSRINQLLIANAKFEHQALVDLANFCDESRASFRIIPDILEIRMGEVLIDESLGLPTIRIKPVSLHGAAFVAKRVMDVALASLILGFLSLPLLMISFLIKATSRGPVLYKHKRVGYRGTEFDFMKFRTMVINADELLEELKKKSDRQGPVFKMKTDPRVTTVGRFLRRYSIDEIPQLLNVLKGEMSLVGPRPQVLWEAKLYDEWAKKRLNVLPGITGLWQVSGRAELTYQEMIDLDIYYIEHWSPGLDIKIMAKTIPAVFMGQGAY